jgi:CO/xanthine dehydrogenase Mo-binding subunit
VAEVAMHPTDTAIGNAGSTSASRQSMMAGGAVQMACQDVRAQLIARAAARLGCLEADLVLEGGRVGDVALVDLLVDPVIATVVYHHRRTEPMDEHGQGDTHVCFAFAAQRAVVEVDTELGLVRVLQIASAIDAGRVLNPLGLAAQVEGGTAQGLGLAVMEEVLLRDGRIANPSFTDYLIPTILDVPTVVTVAVEVPEPDTPYGLKGIGESPTVVATAAVIAAVRDATGLELNRAPATPEHVSGLLGPACSAGPPACPEVPGQQPVPAYHNMRSGQQNLM